MDDSASVSSNGNSETTKISNSHKLYHENDSVNTLLEELQHIKSLRYNDLSQEELSIYIERLQAISDRLLPLAKEETELLNFVNEAEHLRDTLNIEKQSSNSTFAMYSRFDEEESDENGNPIMSRKFMDKLLCTNFKMYYRTHELNDTLYLHFKGFKRIDNLQTFVNLKVLYLESNCIKKIENLGSLKHLTSLYLHQNLIEKIEGLEGLENLVTLNLSENMISTVENLGHNKRINSILLKRNRIGYDRRDLEGILEIPESCW